MKAYKGFHKDMTCRGYQFEEGKTYTEETAKLCSSGFHACEYPLDCLSYYSPAYSVFHEVDLEDVSDERQDDTKVCGKTIKIGASLDIAGMVKESFYFVMRKCISENDSVEDRSANSATGDYSANSATGCGSANVSTGEHCMNSGCADTINVGWGYNNRCRGKIGAYIVLCERGNWDGEKYPLIGEPVLRKIDGIILKEDTWYTLKHGEIVECDD